MISLTLDFLFTDLDLRCSHNPVSFYVFDLQIEVVEKQQSIQMTDMSSELMGPILIRVFAYFFLMNSMFFCH